MAQAVRVAAGQIALIEPEEFGPQGWSWAEPLRGIVEDNDNDDVLTITVAPSDLVDGTEVMVSVFAPEALYRIRAAARWLGPTRLAIDPIHDVERVQRRRWARHEIHLDVTLAPLRQASEPGPAANGASESVAGRTLDIGMGGLRVETDRPLAGAKAEAESEAEAAPVAVNVTLMLPDGIPLVARASVVSAMPGDRGFEYRLAFDRLDDLDVANLTALLDPQATAADIRRKAAHSY